MSKRKSPLTRHERIRLYNILRRVVPIGEPKGRRMTRMQRARVAAIARRTA